jgi:hypothetical protein
LTGNDSWAAAGAAKLSNTIDASERRLIGDSL